MAINKVNLELKHHCSDFKKVRTVLKQLGAKKEIGKKQKDYFFNLPIDPNHHSPRLKLRIERNKKTLVYYERPNFTQTKGARAEVKLYSVKDNRLLPFLQKVFGIKAVVEKKREVWRKKNTVFHIDTVKGVGGIFEIELQKKDEITASDTELFKIYRHKFLPFLGDGIKGSNVDLVSKKRKK